MIPRDARFRALAFTSLAHGVNDGMVFFVSLAADFLANLRHVSAPETTAMLVLFNLASAILSVFVGRWADRSGQAGSLIALGMALLSTGLAGLYVGMVYTSGLLLFLTVLGSAALAGFGSAFYHPLGGAILQRTFADTSRGRALGANGSIGSIGRAAYPSLFYAVPILATVFDPFGILALVGFAVATVIWVGLRGWRAPAPAPAPSAAAADDGRHSLRRAATRGAILLTAVVFVRSMATQGVVSWLSLYVTRDKGAGLGAILGGIITIMYVPAIFGQPAWGWLVDHYDRRVVLGLSSAAAAACLLAYVLTAGWVSILFLALFGLFTFSGFPLFLSLAADYVPRADASVGNALVWGVGASGGSVVGPLLVGAIIGADYARLGLAFEILAGVALVSAMGTALLPRQSPPASRPSTP